MIRLADLVTQYAAELLSSHTLLPSQLAALSAFKNCRSATSPKMQLACSTCEHEVWLPHSCGNRHCPHCQAHESQRWIDQQLQKLVPGKYFMITHTLPAEFRSLVWQHQRELYELIIRCAWETVNQFSQNDAKLSGSKLGLALPASYPEKWIVDCKAVGSGHKALVYFGRYLYRGVLPEKNIVSNIKGQVTFRYQNSTSKKMETRTLPGAAFLKLLLQHILPKGFRRARNFGFLHHNSKLVKLVQWIKKVFVPPPQPRPTVACPCCGNPLRILRTRVRMSILRRSDVLDREMPM